jgi:membrane-bound serine protease (ClpP class)
VGVPAAIGVLAFVLAAVGLNAIPVNLAGIALILASIALFIAEVFVTSFGLLSLLGLGLLLLGAALLMDRTQPNFFADPSVSVSWSLVVPTASLLALGVIALGVRARKVRARPFWGGDEELLGAEGLALTEVDAEHGQVQVRGEIWQARSSSSIPPGSRVRVEKRQGLMLAVRSA